jgi:hypothetical protein
MIDQPLQTLPASEISAIARQNTINLLRGKPESIAQILERLPVAKTAGKAQTTE